MSALPKDKPIPKPDYYQLTQLLNIMRFMGVERDLKHVLPYLANACVKAINADRCSIFLVDYERNEIWSKHVVGEDEIRFPYGQGIAGECIRTGEVIVIDHPYEDPRFNPEIDKQTGYETKNLLVVPLRNQNDVITGCFEVINKIDGTFTEADQALLKAFGVQASVAIETALLVEEKESMINDLLKTEQDLTLALAQLSAVFEIETCAGKGSTPRDLAQIALEKALDSVSTDVDSAGLLLVHPDSTQHFYAMKQKGQLLHSPSDHTSIGSREDVMKFLEQTFKYTPSKVLGRSLIMSSDDQGQQIVGSFVLTKSKSEFAEAEVKSFDLICNQLSSVCQRKNLQFQKSRSDRMVMIGQIAASMVHDIRNPLSTISSIGTLLGMGHDTKKEELDEYCQIIEREVSRANNMLEELLDFARGQRTLNIEPVAVSEFINQIRGSLEAQAKKLGAVLTIDNRCQGDFQIDQDRLMRVVFNIANNSFEVVDEGGTLTITAENFGDDVLLTLKDDGPGIPKAIADRIFEAFVTHGKSQGTGLGMYIAKEIVTAHRGSISLAPSDGNGACFLVRIPRRQHP